MDQSQIKNPTPKSPALSWQAPEFQEYQKHPLWFAAVAVITAGLVLYGIFTKSWTMAVVFGLAGLMAVVYAAQKPNTITITLSGLGVQIGKDMFAYRDLVKFWILYTPPDVKALYVESKSSFNRVIKIELADQDPISVRTYLKEYLVEDLEQQESLADIIARKLKF